ncbi:hypothetical protein KHQ81_13390 [Mycoplasmatota bacterium]|nr:hypothetical protein KHQ81_13390 [Mycoplasmatota bacterium]
MKDKIKKINENVIKENTTNNQPKIETNQTNKKTFKPSLNEIYEMKSNNYSDYSTETLEKLE